jgi:hypothetical protein
MIDLNWRYRDLQVIRLENEFITIDVLPELGAKIFNFIHRMSNRNLLWHNPRIPPARQSIGAKFDDVWSGGWDELMPNDIPTPVLRNEMLQDHGEIWSQPSEYQINADETSVRFRNLGHVLPTVFEKTISLQPGQSHCTIQYRLTNMAREPIDFLWNIHPAMAISPATRLDVPAVRGIVEKWGTDHFDAGTIYNWPIIVDRAGQKIDMTRVPPAESNIADQHYLPAVSQGWYGVTDTNTRIGFGMSFPTNVFPNLWLFRTLGGWRGLYTLILEVSNGLSSDLAVARQKGQCGHLDAGQTIVAEIKAVAYDGYSSVERINSDGSVQGK